MIQNDSLDLGNYVLLDLDMKLMKQDNKTDASGEHLPDSFNQFVLLEHGCPIWSLWGQSWSQHLFVRATSLDQSSVHFYEKIEISF